MIKFSYDDMIMAKALINRPADGTVANQQAREIAAARLTRIAEGFASLANKNPETEVAEVLRGMAKECMIDAQKA